ncbi:hypothetical protein C8F01DRAFT_1247747 [Mycena amicta]|nr:hypothetical protein C8F01DRAFT_1266764 [Mycena amicta]KAJ7067370.1 hypothetical protein C8F01DRAFT_1247747 [Mycena amicta]
MSAPSPHNCEGYTARLSPSGTMCTTPSSASPAGRQYGLGALGNGSEAVMPIRDMQGVLGRGGCSFKLSKVIQLRAQIELRWVMAYSDGLGITPLVATTATSTGDEMRLRRLRRRGITATPSSCGRSTEFPLISDIGNSIAPLLSRKLLAFIDSILRVAPWRSLHTVCEELPPDDSRPTVLTANSTRRLMWGLHRLPEVDLRVPPLAGNVHDPLLSRSRIWDQVVLALQLRFEARQ